ncbi:MAG TPA: hypothetical protein VNH11_11185 [Pirellulales bacterium]|nr:hypothetical protein [Pirellulales bacterium]
MDEQWSEALSACGAAADLDSNEPRYRRMLAYVLWEVDPEPRAADLDVLARAYAASGQEQKAAALRQRSQGPVKAGPAGCSS